MSARPGAPVSGGGERADWTHLCRADELGGTSLLHSVQVGHGVPKHMHETYTVGVVNTGVVANVVRGSTEYLAHGDLFIDHPGEVHSGAPAGRPALVHKAFGQRPRARRAVARSLRGAVNVR